MGRFLLIAGLPLAGCLATATPAAARYAEKGCGDDPPTGQALPRQATAANSTRMLDRAFGTGRHIVGHTRRGETVTVLEECGGQRRIRTPEGSEGWVPIFSLPQENGLMLNARSRQHDAEYDCELKYLNDHTTDRMDACKAALAQKKPQ